MPIAVACSCGAKLNVPDHAAGKRVRCSRCGAVVPVPVADDGFRVLDESTAPSPPERAIKCVYCGNSHAATAPACPHCGHKSAMEAAGAKPCGSCGAGNPADAVACTQCGFDLLSAPAASGTKVCPFCAETIKAAAIICPHCRERIGGAVRPSRAPERERDLSMEAHLSAIGVWYRIGGVLGGIACCFMFIGALGMSGKRGMESGPILMITVLVAALSVGSYALGHFLSRYSNGARITAGVLQIISLVGNAIQLLGILGGNAPGRPGSGAEAAMMGRIAGILFGVAWTIAVLWVLFSHRSVEICSPDYQRLVYRTPEVKPPTFTSPFFWIPLICVGLLVIFVALGMMATKH